ncbi:uncharacterized protein N7483_010098 [Penicillium malachiteum]|uniref:uncharacterized protein n=1 Tax=Penicillium malachiteum TaxID=1324776 RepID=UPI00254800D9|nr:uncharacterized protein N7483_010098 [Penicillium malachiteum]KAJ5712917.1 hypothetical protein N7483_010098 [Penicillium malachiteum]
MYKTTPSAARLLASKQVHIQMAPTPKKLQESRQILAALQKFGEVTTFRNLKYDIANTTTNQHRPIIAIFESADAAQRAIASSPLIITLDQATNTNTTQPTHTSSESSVSSSSNSSEEIPSDVKPDDAKPDNAKPDDEGLTKYELLFKDVKPGTMKCIIEASRHNHQSNMRRNPWYAAYEPNKEDPIYKDMMNPQTGTPLRGLGDVLQRNCAPSTPERRYPVRFERRSMGADSLMEMWTDAPRPEEGEESLVDDSIKKDEKRPAKKCGRKSVKKEENDP